MPAQIYQYTKITEPGPNGRSLVARLPEGAIELCTLDNVTYVSIPEGLAIPEQHPEITLTPVIVDYGLRERIKASSRACQLIAEEMQQRIRAQYSVEDEQYFARIGVGAALGAYTFQPGEQEVLLGFGAFVEEVRQWGRERREELGL